MKRKHKVRWFSTTAVILQAMEKSECWGRIVEALTVAPAALVGIRTELAAQLKRHKEHAEKLERTKRYREIEERRAARADRPLDQPV